MKLLGHKYLLMLCAAFFILLISSCGSGNSVRRERKKQEKILRHEYVDEAELRGDRKRIVEEAITWLGTPYKYAGQEKGVCADCSGMVMQIYLSVLDVKLPRNSAKQAEFCKKIKAKDVRPGDLVFFATGKDSSKVSHVGIMLDEMSFIHASSSKGVVVSRMDNRWYAQRLRCYGRVPGLK